jgi:hypothetical protein
VTTGHKVDFDVGTGQVTCSYLHDEHTCDPKVKYTVVRSRKIGSGTVLYDCYCYSNTVFNVGLFSFLYVSFCGLSGATSNTQQDEMVSIIPQ